PFFAMRCAGGLVGALGIGHKDGRVPLSTEDEALLAALMAQAGLAYENARLYGALAERLEEIKTLQEYQESVIRSSSSGIVVLDADQRIHTANPAFALLTGRSEDELRGMPLTDLLPDVDLGAATAPHANTGELRVAAVPPGSDDDRRRDPGSPALGLLLPRPAGPARRRGRGHDRSHPRRACPRGTGAAGFARRPRGRRRARGQHADRGPVLL